MDSPPHYASGVDTSPPLKQSFRQMIQLLREDSRMFHLSALENEMRMAETKKAYNDGSNSHVQRPDQISVLLKELGGIHKKIDDMEFRLDAKIEGVEEKLKGSSDDTKNAMLAVIKDTANGVWDNVGEARVGLKRANIESTSMDMMKVTLESADETFKKIQDDMEQIVQMVWNLTSEW